MNVARSWAQEHPGVATYDSLEALAAAGAEAVAISTPADTHSSVTDQAIDWGFRSSATSRSPSTRPRHARQSRSPRRAG